MYYYKRKEQALSADTKVSEQCGIVASKGNKSIGLLM